MRTLEFGSEELSGVCLSLDQGCDEDNEAPQQSRVNYRCEREDDGGEGTVSTVITVLLTRGHMITQS